MAMSKAHIQRYKALHQTKGRREAGRFLVESPEMIREALAAGWRLTEAVITTAFSESPEGEKLVAEMKLADVPCEICTTSDMERITDAKSPQGAAAMARIAGGDEQSTLASEVIIFCEQISDPGNLGTILRTADWFGIQRIFTGPGSADLFNPKVVRSTAGAIFRVSVESVPDCEAFLTSEVGKNRKLFAAVMDGRLISRQLPVKGFRGIVLGHETRGVSQGIRELCTDTVRIERYGKTESLNLSVAAGILMNALVNG